MPIDYIAFVLRLLHVLAVITVVGGSIFLRFALLPAEEAADGSARPIHDELRRRWARLIYVSILFLLISGLANFVMFLQAAKTWPREWHDTYYSTYQMLFGIKFLLAMAIFALASILAGRSPGTQKMRDNPRKWLNVNLALALAVIMISGLLRLTHVGPTAAPEQATVKTTTGG
jgi:uncharacterized membrane protein